MRYQFLPGPRATGSPPEIKAYAMVTSLDHPRAAELRRKKHLRMNGDLSPHSHWLDIKPLTTYLELIHELILSGTLLVSEAGKNEVSMLDWAVTCHGYKLSVKQTRAYITSYTDY